MIENRVIDISAIDPIRSNEDNHIRHIDRLTEMLYGILQHEIVSVILDRRILSLFVWQADFKHEIGNYYTHKRTGITFNGVECIGDYTEIFIETIDGLANVVIKANINQ